MLIQGKTGCGKELVAHSIHKGSTRGLRNFIKVNCAAIPSELFESEIFGYEEGSFTGAKKGGNKGKAELANGGTLFLDEINQLPMNLQAKLLRFLQEKEITRVGGNFAIPVDIRVIAATNEPLESLVKKNLFREDLYYRLNVLEINIAPLKERKEDIPLLAKHIIGELNSTLGRESHKVTKIDDRVLEFLCYYDWPGNVRELHNILERSMNRCYEDTLKIEHLQDFLNSKKIYQYDLSKFTPKTLQEIRNEIELQAILATLEAVNGNKTEAAKILGISRQMLHRILKKQSYS